MGSRPQIRKPEAERKEFYCTMCGHKYTVQKGNFYYSQSPLYAGNNKYMSICRKCVDALFEHYKEVLGDEEEATKRTCCKLDIYFSHDVYEMTHKTNETMSRMAAMIAKTNLRQNSDKTFDDTLDETKTDIIMNEEDIADVKENSSIKVTQTAINRWGLGFSPEEYSFCENLYKMFKLANPRADGVQETFIKDLVTTKVLQNRAFKENNADNYAKYSKIYQDTLKVSKLKMTDEDEQNVNDETVCWGNFVKDVEQYTPADLYLNKKLFDDADQIKEYFKRFIVRPFKNFFTGSKDMDEEFSILPGDDDA